MTIESYMDNKCGLLNRAAESEGTRLGGWRRAGRGRCLCCWSRRCDALAACRLGGVRGVKCGAARHISLPQADHAMPLTITMSSLDMTIGHHRAEFVCMAIESPRPGFEEIVLLDLTVNSSFQMLHAYPSIGEPGHPQPHRGPLCQLHKPE